MNSYLVSCRNCAGPQQYGDEANNMPYPSDETLHGKAELLMRSFQYCSKIGVCIRHREGEHFPLKENTKYKK